MQYKVLKISEGDYGCEELPEGEPVRVLVLLEDADGSTTSVLYPDEELYAKNIETGCMVELTDGRMELLSHSIK